MTLDPGAQAHLRITSSGLHLFSCTCLLCSCSRKPCRCAFTKASVRRLTLRIFGQRRRVLADQGLDVGNQKLD